MLWALLALNIAIVSYFWAQTSGPQLSSGLSAMLIAMGRYVGLLAVLLILGQLVMISRVRWLEQTIGFDAVTRYHRINGQALLYLVAAHPVLLSVGYSLRAQVGPVQQFLTLLTWPHVYLALIGWCMILILGIVAAVRAIRRRLTYEQWYYTHLSLYLAIILVFFHQVDNGADFGDPLFRLYWKAIYVIAFGMILVYRFAIPLALNWRHRFVVDHVERITPSAVNVYIKGKNFESFDYQPGQFGIWYFLDSKRWWSKHPFTISVEPGQGYLRISAKGVGDFTKEMEGIVSGTKVLLDGPYGVFTPSLTSNKKILMIAGGSGITPLRAMLPPMLEEGRDVVMLYGSQTTAETMLGGELQALTANNKFVLHRVLSDEPKFKAQHGYITGSLVKTLVPDCLERDVYLCGPPVMVGKLLPQLRTLGFSDQQIHYERFSL